MPKFSQTSLSRLATCHPLLQKLLLEAIKQMDFTILCGYRGQQEQDKAFLEGKSTLRFPHGKHNKNPSLAVDIAPYPIDWTNIRRFNQLAILMKSLAKSMNIDLGWGGDWRTLKDRPHYQLNSVPVEEPVKTEQLDPIPELSELEASLDRVKDRILD